MIFLIMNVHTCFTSKTTKFRLKNLIHQSNNQTKNATTSMQEQPLDDGGTTGVYERIRKNVEEFATISMAKSNLAIKKKLVGALGDNYPKDLVDKALKIHNDKQKWKRLMLIPNKIYRFCIFPGYQLNYAQWCSEKYSTKDKQKLVNCKNTFCHVCCDNLQIMLRNQADNNVIGELLGLAKASGFADIQKAVTKQQIHECRKQCAAQYPVQFPKPPLPVPRDPKLGKWAEFPAKSCADIKKWGAENNDSGTYWIELGSKGKAQVYCDMYSLRGGWTLFFNYMKLPNSDVKIESGKLPNSLKRNSHMNLLDAGFSESDVQEIRFFCTEKTTEKIYWHFKTDSPKLINTAFTGDQRKMDLDELKSTYTEMQFPGKAILWTKAMDQLEMLESLDFTKTNPIGGFWDTPFGTKSKKKFWTVKGEDKNNPRFECGTFHKSNIESATAYTHHTVWFRGEPPSENFARARYYNKEIKRLKKKTKEEEEMKNKQASIPKK